MTDRKGAIPVGKFVMSGRRPPRKADELTHDKIIGYLRDLAIRHPGKQISTRFVEKEGYINPNTIIRRFGSFSKALIEAGITPTRKYKRDRVRMITELGQLIEALGRSPSKAEIVNNTHYNSRDYEIEFDTLEEAILISQNLDHNPLQRDFAIDNQVTNDSPSRRSNKRRKYGDRINYMGLRHAPVNELGVVFLFGMIAAKLGYEVESIHAGFPDCEAKRPRKGGGFERVEIEFEFKSSNFRRDHDINGCDIIVCWEHNWK